MTRIIQTLAKIFQKFLAPFKNISTLTTRLLVSGMTPMNLSTTTLEGVKERMLGKILVGRSLLY